MVDFESEGSGEISHEFNSLNSFNSWLIQQSGYAYMLPSSADGPYTEGTGMLLSLKYTPSCAR